MSERDSICALAEKLGDEYREVVGFPGYFLRRDGTLWSAWELVRTPNVHRVLTNHLRPMKTSKNVHGYHILQLKNKDAVRQGMLSRAMLEAFVGPPPFSKACACHNDGNKNNNSIENLRWDSRSGNERDKVRHGTSNDGERNGMAKATADLVRKIRARYLEFPAGPGGNRAGATKAIAEEMKIPRRLVINILRKDCWKNT